MNGGKKLKKESRKYFSLFGKRGSTYKHKLKDNDWELNISWEKTMPAREKK
jgi:hypothetical protein